MKAIQARRRIYFVFLLAILPGFALGQGIFRHLTENDGLPGNYITCLAKDDLGQVWIGTSRGLVKYEGANFFPLEISPEISLSRTHISCLYYDSRKTMWIGTVEFGLYSINTRTGKSQAYFHETDRPGSLPDNRITAILEDDKGELWFGVHRKGIARLNRETGDFEGFRPSIYFPDLSARETDVALSLSSHPAHPGKIWIGTLNGLFVFDQQKKTFSHFLAHSENLKPAEHISQLTNLILAIQPADSGKFWLGTWGGGLLLFDPAEYSYQAFLFEQKKPVRQIRNVIKQIVPAENQELIVSISGEESSLARFNPETGRFSMMFMEESELLGTRAKVFFKDEADNTWIGTAKGLFMHLNRPTPFQYTSLPFPVNGVYPHPDGIRLFISVRQKPMILVMDRNTLLWKTYRYEPLLKKGPLLNAIYNAHFLRNGSILLMENTDLFIFDESQDTILPLQKIEVPEIRKMQWGFLQTILDRNDNIWLGNKYAGLFKLNPQTGELRSFKKEANQAQSLVHTAWVNDLFEAEDGSIWYGTEEGWGRVSPDGKDFLNFPYNSRRSGKPGVQLKEANCLTQASDGNIWLGSSNKGLAVFPPDASPSDTLKTFTVTEGLRSDAILDLCPGANGDVWVTTKSGLSHLGPEGKDIRNFGREYGLEDLHELTTDGKFIFAPSGNGFFYFLRDSLPPKRNPPEVLLHSFKVLGKEIEEKTALNYLKEIELDYDENFIAIEYGALNFFDPELVEYSYRIKRLDPDWVYAGTRGYCNYTDIRPGKHKLEIRARIESGEWGKAKSILIKISPPFWQTWWFILGAILAGLGLVFAVLNWRLNQIRKQADIEQQFLIRLQDEEKKALQAQMNPHFIFNCLNSIKLLILKEDKKQAAHYLTRFSQLIRLVLQNSEQSLVDLEEELKALELYMALEQMRLSHRFDFSIEIAPDIDPGQLQIPPLILQPLVENAIWHGLSHKKGPGKLSLKISRDREWLRIEIQDNGVGRAAAAKLRKSSPGHKKSFGLALTRERLKLGVSAQSVSQSMENTLELQDLLDSEGQPAGTLARIRISFSSLLSKN